MADVTEVIDRDAADIHSHFLFLERDKLLFLTGQGVVDANGHDNSSWKTKNTRLRLRLRPGFEINADQT
jgi:hypothetical protein